MNRYDGILLGIAVSITGGWLAGIWTALPLAYGMVVGVLLATPFVYDAMFRNPPIPESDVQRAAAAIVWHVLLIGTILAVMW